MQFKNTTPPIENKNFKEVIFNSLAQNKSLFVPEMIPQLSDEFLQNLSNYSIVEIGAEVLSPFTEGFISKDELIIILEEALSFEIPLVKITEQIQILELFHGPTQAFKDVGARTMSRVFSKLNSNQIITILAATSGDTGSAVANGFYNVEGIDVVVLFPKGKVSAYQEHQMTSLGKNIRAVEVDGDFDDCQRLVKMAFHDDELAQKLNLSSANSINLARLLPQMIYYFWMIRNLKNTENKEVVVCVPSGNLGNLTAGLYAKKMGLPIQRFIAAENENDSFYRYLETGKHQPENTIKTYSNAMDVGAPSNFERIVNLYQNDWEKIKTEINGAKTSDKQTLETIRRVKLEYDYVLDPHGAVGFAALENRLQPNEIGVLFETAHPKKFESAVQKALPDFQSPKVDLLGCKKDILPSAFDNFKNYLLE